MDRERLTTLTEGALDEALDAWRVAAPSHALREAVLARAPQQARGLGRFAWMSAWMSGAGLATAAVAGVLVGAALTPSAPHVGEFEAMTASIYSDAAAPLTIVGNSAAEPESAT